MDCALCENKICREGKDCFDLQSKVKSLYADESDFKLYKAASELEVEEYCRLNRIQEIVAFAKKMNFKHLGLAFCVGLSEEANILARFFKQYLQVTSVCCKISGFDKKNFDLPYLFDHPAEAICNPILQAELLNQAGTDFNVAVGLCVGHDMLFNKYSRSPVTTLIVKDRVLGNNPVMGIYCQYIRKRLLL